MRCDLCQATKDLMPESTKVTLRSNWAGVDFYNEICNECWNKQEENI